MNHQEFQQMAVALRPRLVSRSYGFVGNAEEAEDVAQETLLRLWELRQRLESRTSGEALGMTICRNLSIDIIRRRHPGNPIEELTGSDVPTDPSATPEAIVEGRDTMSMVERTLGLLAPSQAAVLRMRHQEGMEIAEIASLTGTTENNVRVLLCRARQRLRELMKE